MIKTLLLSVATFLLIVGAYLVSYLGLWKSVQISVVEVPALSIVFEEHTGPYHEIAKVIDRVEQLVKSEGGGCEKTFGQYFDDPRVVEDIRLRSRGGCIASSSKNLKSDTIPSGQRLQAIFEGAPSVGPMKVYPAVESFAREKSLRLKAGSIEIYEVLGTHAMRTTYLFEFE